ncbi:C-type lectin domain family 4, member a4 [Apodemus speciosus]|uniref:C-type lectin domain family 4, member a4 n=1 Tax=Apodemus speciosus TaxID=105296 RepID=A0ABQ0EWV5_APOSI
MGAPSEKRIHHLNKFGSPSLLFTSLVVFLLLLAITFLGSFIIYFQKYSQLLEKKAIKDITYNELCCTKNVSLMEGKDWSCCPKDWKPFGSHCYFILSNLVASWNKTKENCTHMGAHLVVIHSQEEQNFVTGILRPGAGYFIGLLDAGHRQWQWIDQTPYNESATFWHKALEKEQGSLSDGGRSFLDMASEITYAEVKFKNESNSLRTYSESPAAPREKPIHHLNKPGSLMLLFTSLMILLLLLAITFLVAFITYFQKYSQLFEEKIAIKNIIHKELNCMKNVSVMEADFITRILNTRAAYFIGLWDTGHRQWRWVDQTPYNKSAIFWHKDEPSNDNEKCQIHF